MDEMHNYLLTSDSKPKPTIEPASQYNNTVQQDGLQMMAEAGLLKQETTEQYPHTVTTE